MAVADVRGFLDRVNRDPELQAKLEAGGGGFVEIGLQQGYRFTKEELHAELRARWGVTRRTDEPDTTTLGEGAPPRTEAGRDETP